jgi:hypothetical protein
MKKLFFIFVLQTWFNVGFAYNISPETKISILTIGKGSELHSFFGHTALRVKDEQNAYDIVYNFGYFDFNTPNFYLKFIKGDLLYHAEVEQYYQLINYYQYLKRTVKEQVLNLTFEEKKALINQLNSIVLSDQRFYIYKFIDDNCTTRVQKIVAKVTDVSLEKVNDTNLSYRQIINNYLDDRYFEKLGINMIFGWCVDQKADQLFLPDELFDSIENKPINQSTSTLYSSDVKHAAPWWNSWWIMLMMLVIIILVNKKGVYLSFLGIIGATGLFFTSIGFYSLHQEVLWNYNVLLFNPIFLLIVFGYFKKNRNLVNILEKIFYVSVLIYLIYMLNKSHLVMMIPFIIALPIMVNRLKRFN